MSGRVFSGASDGMSGGISGRVFSGASDGVSGRESSGTPGEEFSGVSCGVSDGVSGSASSSASTIRWAMDVLCKKCCPKAFLGCMGMKHDIFFTFIQI